MKKKDIFIQESPSSCGACSVASVVSFYGGYIPLEVILEDTETNRNGTNAYNIVNALKRYGFDSEGIHVEFKDIDKHLLPFIAHVTQNGYEHFLVVYEIDETKVLTMDPGVGKKYLSIIDFENMYNKTIITASPINTIPKYEGSKSLFRMFTQILKGVKQPMIIAFVICLFALILNIFLSLHLKILNLGFNAYTLMFCFIVLRLIMLIIDFIKNRLLNWVIEHCDKFVLTDFTKHVFNLPLKVIKNRRVGEIIRKIEDLAFIKDLMLNIVLINSIDIFTIAITLILMFIISKQITFIYLIIVITYLLISILTQKVFYNEEKRSIMYHDEYYGNLVEYLTGLESIKNLNSEEDFLGKINTSLNKYLTNRTRKNNKYKLINTLKSIPFGIGSILVNTLGFLLLSDQFTFLDLLVLESLFSIFYSSFENILNTILDIIKGKALFRSVSEFYDLEPERCGLEFKENLKNLNIDCLSYTYTHLTYNIKNFSYNLENNDKVLLSGPSGIGKSTLVKILSGALTDYEGVVKINDTNIRDISLKSLREYITYIGQEETLFTDSILENIILGDESHLCDLDYIYEVTLLNGVLNSKRDKEKTSLLEGASNLSGGERARVILARALYKRPKILIIDETLSSIGIDDEKTIIKNLLKMNISLIYISHRQIDDLFTKKIQFRKDGTYEIKG